MNRNAIKKLLLSYGYLDNVYLDKYLDSFKNHSALFSLINLNAPNTMSESNYNSIIETLNNFEKNLYCTLK